MRVALLQPLQADQPQQLRHARGAPPPRQPETDVRGDAQVREERALLGDEADPPALGGDVGGRSGELAAAEAHRARVGPLEAGDHPQQRRLAAAGRPEDRGQAARRDLEIEPAQNLGVAEGLRQAGDYERRAQIPPSPDRPCRRGAGSGRRSGRPRSPPSAPRTAPPPRSGAPSPSPRSRSPGSRCRSGRAAASRSARSRRQEDQRAAAPRPGGCAASSPAAAPSRAAPRASAPPPRAPAAPAPAPPAPRPGPAAGRGSRRRSAATSPSCRSPADGAAKARSAPGRP